MRPKSLKIIPLLLTSLMLIIFSSGTSLAQCSANICMPLNQNFGTPPGGVCNGAQGANPYIVNHCNYPCIMGPAIDDGEYRISCDGTNFNAGWWGGNSSYIEDHTVSGQGGYFAMINGGTGPREFLHRTVTGLCPTATYTFSFWAANVSQYNATDAEKCGYSTADVDLRAYTYAAGTAVQPNNTFSTAGATRTLVNTGNIFCTSGGLVWTQYTNTFTATAAEGTNGLDIVLVTMEGGTAGGDFVIDDITITYASGGPAGFSPCTTTPVELISFTAEELSQSALLKWSTAMEKNFSHFSIEKSEDGINFSEIDKVNGKGSASAPASYEFFDFDFHSASYYRLKMIDHDASAKYSNVVSLLSGINRYCKVFRKESGELEIRANIQQSGSIKILVYSVLGQKYAEEDIDLAEGTNVIVKDFHLGDKNVLVRIIASDGEVLFSNIVSSF